MQGEDPGLVWVYSDTDSVVESSNITINSRDIQIGELWDQTDSPIITTASGNEVKALTDAFTPTLTDSKELVQKRVPWVMRHKVKKRMYRITVGGNSVEVTEDHSIIVERCSEIISVKPSDIIKGDGIISLDGIHVNYSEDFTIEDLGVQDQYVYDIEVEDIHRFFANNILVHNSCYFTLQKFVEKIQDKVPEDKLIDFLDQFIESKIQPQIDKTFEDLSEYMNCFQNSFGAKREAIANSMILRKKKNYAMLVSDLEGTRFNPPIIKVTGIETQRSSTPQVVRNVLKECLGILLSGTEHQLRDRVERFEAEFKTLPIEDISFPRGVSEVTKWIDANGRPRSGCPIHVRASIVHNHAVDELKLKNVRKVKDGDKIKFVYLKPNPFQSNVIGFMDSVPEEFKLDQWIDYETQFQKTFLGPLESLAVVANWNLVEQSSLEDFFG